ncbi:MAG: MFS transporter [Thalassovita sp.]
MNTYTLDSRYAWMRLGLSVLIGVIGSVGMWMIISILPAIEREFGLDRAQTAYPYIATMVGFGLGNFLIGTVVDRLGITKALSSTALLIGAGFLLATLSPTLLVLSILHFVIGLGTAASFGPLIADVSLWFMKRRGIAVAIVASANYLSGAFWPVVLSDLQAAQGWRAVYIFLGIMCPLTLIPLAQLLRRRVPAAILAQSNATSAARTRASGFSHTTLVLMLGAAGVACCVAMSMPQVHIVAFCVDLGYGPAVGAEMLSLMLLGGVASRLVSGLLSDRLGGLTTLLIGSALQMLALFLYLPFDGLVSLYVVSTLFGLAQGGIVPSYAVIVREFMPAEQAGARVGFVMMTTVIGMALGGWLSGLIYDLSGSYQLAFWNGIGWNALNLSIAVIILLRSQRPQPAHA